MLTYCISWLSLWVATAEKYQWAITAVLLVGLGDKQYCIEIKIDIDSDKL